MIGRLLPGSSPCSHSLSHRLSKKLALLTMAILAVLSVSVYLSVKMFVIERGTDTMQRQAKLYSAVLALEDRAGGEPAVLARLQNDAQMRADRRLELFWPDGRPFYADAPSTRMQASEHVQTLQYTLSLPGIHAQPLLVRFSVDFADDARMGQRWTWILILTTLGAGALVAVGASWHVKRALEPVRSLAAQTRQISPQALNQRLALQDPAEELLPLVEQFNALMGRLERAYTQLEGFNADVAHELRTPLAALIGHTELALSRARDAGYLRDTMAGNLEELQRLSAMVNDMLFLASADRGAQARRSQPVSLAELTRQVVEFHEAPLEDARLAVQIEGDAELAVDEPLIKRALSNLIGNATRYAEPGSTVTVRITAEGLAASAAGEPATVAAQAPDSPRGAAGSVRLEVENSGPQIEPALLPRIFDRFFRADDARHCPEQAKHHGLGLAIVAAIARMHQGEPLAESAAGRTRVGLRLPLAAA
jgi:two-component system heavy metal sensor histidine kinase CusS